MWIFDKLFNRKIEGKSSLDALEPVADKFSLSGDKVIVDGDLEADSLTSKGIANTGALANIGNVAVSGDLTANSIIENMSGYSYTPPAEREGYTLEPLYVGCVKNGNKLTIVQFMKIKRTAEHTGNNFLSLGSITIPSSIGEKLTPYTISGQPAVDNQTLSLFSTPSSIQSKSVIMNKTSDTQLSSFIYAVSALTLDTEYIFRFETTLLLSDSLVLEVGE